MDVDLVSLLERGAARVFPDTPVRFAYLFGSRAGGRPRPGSDVDVAVFLGGGPEMPDRLTLSLHLAGRLAKESGEPDIDLVVLDDAPLPLVGRVLQSRIVIYSRDEPTRVRFESRRLREFLDFQIRAEPLDRLLLAEIAAGRR
ncbi:MAG: type VII toxin-antitoxin system MntA family adenylyltransferase antitoxin [Egibacteraceae bacterium]